MFIVFYTANENNVTQYKVIAHQHSSPIVDLIVVIITIMHLLLIS